MTLQTDIAWHLSDAKCFDTNLHHRRY